MAELNEFERELALLLDRHDMGVDLGTTNSALAKFLADCLDAFADAVDAGETRWEPLVRED